jgi:hypothetical protein
MAWVGTGAVWTMTGGVLKGAPLGYRDRGSRMPRGGLRFVQISDSHIGFRAPANTDVTSPLVSVVDQIAESPEAPALVLHTGDLTQLSKRAEFDTVESVLSRCRRRCSSCPASTTSWATMASGIGSGSARARRARGGTASITACTSSGWSTSSA